MPNSAIVPRRVRHRATVRGEHRTFRHEDDRHRRRETVEKLGIKGTVTVE